MSTLSYCACFFCSGLYHIQKEELQNTTLPFVCDLLFKEKIKLLYSYRVRINGNASTTLCNMQQQIVNIH
mgnify:CR=1 FL=1